MTNIMKDFDEPGFLAPTGLFLGPTKYMVIQGEPGAVIRGKKVLIRRRLCSPSRSPNIMHVDHLSLVSLGIWRHNCEEDRASDGGRHLRRAHDPRPVQHGGREARRLPRRARPVNGFI
jgi:hypothetical protein